MIIISTQRDAHPQAAAQLQSEPAGLTRFHTGRATHARRELKGGMRHHACNYGVVCHVRQRLPNAPAARHSISMGRDPALKTAPEMRFCTLRAAHSIHDCPYSASLRVCTLINSQDEQMRACPEAGDCMHEGSYM